MPHIRQSILSALALLLALPLVSAFYLVEPKIIGGEDETDPPAFIVHLSIEFKNVPGSSVCGGSYIGDRRVLTAAHCLQSEDGHSVSQVSMTFGTQEGDIKQAGTVMTSRTFAIFRGYEFPIHDAAVIFLSEDPPAAVEPVQLATASQAASWISNEETVTALGWGLTENGGSAVDQLQTVDMQLNRSENCGYGSRICNEEGLLFAGANDDGLDTCQGDSGGPLVHKETGILVGLTSFGPRDCATEGLPGGYTRVSAYSDWARTITAARLEMQYAALDHRQDVSEGSFSLALLALISIPALVALRRRRRV